MGSRLLTVGFTIGDYLVFYIFYIIIHVDRKHLTDVVDGFPGCRIILGDA